jgi:hypothetical protein
MTCVPLIGTLLEVWFVITGFIHGPAGSRACSTVSYCVDCI